MRSYPLFLWAIGLALVVASEAVMAARGDPVPQRIPPFTELIDISQVRSTSEPFYTGLQDKRVGIVLTKNADVQMQWNKDSLRPSGADAFAMSAMGIMGRHQKLAEEYLDPKTLTGAVLDPFLRRAREVKVFSDLAEFQDSKFDLVAIVDVNYHREISGFLFREHQYGVQVDAHLFDAALRRGPTITSKSLLKSDDEGAWDALFGSRNEALQKFQAQATSVLGPIRPVVQAAPAPQKSSAAERLQQVDDLKARGLISGQEAAEKRKQILGDL